MDTRTGLPIVGMVGGGQLARMTHQAAIALGQSLHVLAVSQDDPAALVSPNITLGSHTDLDALAAFAKGCDVLTFDHEHVPGEHLQQLVDQGVHVRPGPDALLHAQDKLVMRRKLAELGLPVPPFAQVESVADVTRFAERARLAVRAQGRARRLRRSRRVDAERRRLGERAGAAPARVGHAAAGRGARRHAP